MPLESRSTYAASRKARGLSGGTRRAVEKAELDGRIKAACIRDSVGKLIGIDAGLADILWKSNTNPTAAAKSGGRLDARESCDGDSWKPDRRTLDEIEEAFGAAVVRFSAVLHAGTGMDPLRCAQALAGAIGAVSDVLSERYGIAFYLLHCYGDMKKVNSAEGPEQLDDLVQAIQAAAEQLDREDVAVIFDWNWGQ